MDLDHLSADNQPIAVSGRFSPSMKCDKDTLRVLHPYEAPEITLHCTMAPTMEHQAMQNES